MAGRAAAQRIGDHGRARRFAAITLLVSSLALTAWWPASATAADQASIDASIARAVQYLESAQRPDGGYGSLLPQRDTSGAVDALVTAAPASLSLGPARAFLSARESGDVDALARAVTAAAAPPGPADLLSALQHDDGGYGLTGDYESDVLDTALALRALVVASQDAAAGRAASWLLVALNAGVDTAEGDDSTAQALIAIDAFRARYGSSPELDAAVEGAERRLVATQLLDGSWGMGALGDRSTALTVSALAGSTALADSLRRAVERLLLGQGVDGSWGSDPYTTALAIRALKLGGATLEQARLESLPDPAIEDADISASSQVVSTGDQLEVSAEVDNVGDATAENVVVEYYIEDPDSGAPPIATSDPIVIAPGTTATVTEGFFVDLPSGRYKVYIVLTSAVGEEQGTTNNVGSINVLVRPPRPPATSTSTVHDWPWGNHDLQQSGITRNRLGPVIDPTPLWRHPAHAKHIVAEGKAFFAEGTSLVARDAKTGALAWSFNAVGTVLPGYPYYRTPSYYNGLVYGSHASGYFALSAGSGRQFIGLGACCYEGYWRETIPLIGLDDDAAVLAGFAGRCTATWDPYDPGSNAGLYIDMVRGCGKNGPGLSAIGNIVYMTSDGGVLTAVDLSQALRDSSTVPDAVIYNAKVSNADRYQAPLVDSNRNIVLAGWATGSDAGRLVSFDPQSATVRWDVTTDTRLDAPPVDYRGTVITIDRAGTVYAFDADTGAPKWSWTAPGYVPPSRDQMETAGQTLVLSGRYLFVPHPDGSIYTLDARDGAAVSRTSFPARPYDLAVDDKNKILYVRTLDGFLGAYPVSQLEGACVPYDSTGETAGPDHVKRVSVGQDGAQAVNPEPSAWWLHDWQRSPALAAGGDKVAFTSRANNLVPGELGAQYDVFVRDVAAEATTRGAPIGPNGAESSDPAVSADGRYVAFVSRRRDIEPASAFGGEHVYLYDRETGTTARVSAGLLGRGGGSNPSISADGRYVAYESYADDLVPSDTSPWTDVYVYDRVTSTNKRVSVSVSGQEGNHSSWGSSISADGGHVAFVGYATNLTPGPVRPIMLTTNAFVVDLVTGEVSLVSADVAGNPITLSSPFGALGSLGISGDGRLVAFSSSAPNLVADDTNSMRDIFVRDTEIGVTERVSVSSSGREAANWPWQGHSWDPSLSADGRYVAFTSSAYNLVPGDGNVTDDVFVHDRMTHETRSISNNAYGVTAAGASGQPSISADGRRVAFASTAADLAPGDTNGIDDIFLYDADGFPPTAADGEGSTTGGGAGTPCPDDGTESDPGAGAQYELGDLAVTPGDIQAAGLEEGGGGAVSVTVTNVGGYASEPTTVRLYDGSPESGALIGEANLDALQKGADASLTFAWRPTGRAGSHTLTAAVDPDRLVFEQVLRNNVASAAVAVGEPTVALAAALDRTSYAFDTAVTTSVKLTNLHPLPRDGRVVVSIQDSGGAEVARLRDAPIAVAGGAATLLVDGWNTGSTPAGEYRLAATYYNSLGQRLRDATATFTVEPDLNVQAGVTSDRPAYGPGQYATIDATATNLSRNGDLTDASMSVEVLSPVGAVIDSIGAPVDDLPQAASTGLRHRFFTAARTPGAYAALFTVFDHAGSPIARARWPFEIASTADTGFGLRGAIAATPHDPVRWNGLDLTYSLSNAGNSDLSGADVWIEVIDPITREIHERVQRVSDITLVAPLTGEATIGYLDLTHGRDYLVTMRVALANGRVIPLARDFITVKPPLTAGAELLPVAERVLVWACDAADQAIAREALGDDAFVTFLPENPGATPNPADDEQCPPDDHRSERAFVDQMRSGDYTQFWLLGRHHPFEGADGMELAARVLQGDGLLVAGGSDQALFDGGAGETTSPLGARFAGYLPAAEYSLDFSAAPFSGHTVKAAGRPVTVTPSSAEVIATAEGTTSGSAGRSVVATRNRYGAGTAIFMALPPRAAVDRAAQHGVLAPAVRELSPAPDQPRPGGVIALNLFARSLGPAAALQFRTSLPSGVSAARPPAGATPSAEVTTDLALPAAGQAHKRLWLRVPAAAGDLTIPSDLWYLNVNDNVFALYGDPPYVANVAVTHTRDTAYEQAIAALDALVALAPDEAQRLDRVRQAVVVAAASTTDTMTLTTNLAGLLRAGRELSQITSIDVLAARVAVSRLTTYVQRELFLSTSTGGQDG